MLNVMVDCIGLLFRIGWEGGGGGFQISKRKPAVITENIDVFLSPSRQISKQEFKLCSFHFLPHPVHFIIHLNFRVARRINWDADNFVQHTIDYCCSWNSSNSVGTETMLEARGSVV